MAKHWSISRAAMESFNFPGSVKYDQILTNIAVWFQTEVPDATMLGIQFDYTEDGHVVLVMYEG